MSGQTPMVSLADVGVAFQDLAVLRGVNATLEAGDYVTVTGRSGAGKSTLLNLLAGTLTPTTGVVSIDGLDTRRPRQRSVLQRDCIGYLFQSAHLVGWMSAQENVALGMRYQGVGRAERLARANQAMDRVGLGSRLTHKPAQLSGGERQRLALARALARRPRLLLADEPTGNLDPDTGASIIDLLEDVGSTVTLVLVTHDMQLAARGRRRWRVEGGGVVEDAEPTVWQASA